MKDITQIINIPGGQFSLDANGVIWEILKRGKRRRFSSEYFGGTLMYRIGDRMISEKALMEFVK